MERQIKQLERSTSGASRGAQGFGRSLAGLQMARFGNQIQWTGRQLQYNWTLPILLAGGAATKFQLDIERAFTRVRKVYGDASLAQETMNNELEALSKNFEALSNRFGVHQTEVIEIASAWAAAGASGVALAKSVKATMTTMVLGEVEAAAATEALIAIQAQYGLTVDGLTTAIATLNVIENQTGISLKGLIEGFARSAGVARNAGVDIRHLGAMLAALTPAAGSATQAGNALKTIISRLLAPTREATEVMGLMGVNTKDVGWQSLTATQRLEVMADKFIDLDDAQKAVVSSVIASRYQINKFDQLMKELTTDTGYYQKALNATADEAYTLAVAQRELNTVLESNPRRLQQIWVILQNASANIVQPLIPYIIYLAGKIKDLVVGFQNLSPEVQKLALAGLLLLAAIGPIVRYLGSIITLFGYFKVTVHLAAIALLTFMKPFMLLGRMLAAGTLGGLSLLAGAFGVLGRVLVAVPVLMFKVVSSLVTMGPLAALAARSLVTVWAAAFAAMRANVIVFTTFVPLAWSAMSFGVATLSQTMVRLVTLSWTMMSRNIIVILSAMRTSAILIFGSMFVNIRTIMFRLVALVVGLGPLLITALTSPWTAAVIAVVIALSALAKVIYDNWEAITDWLYDNTSNVIEAIIRAWYALPKGISGALIAVVTVVRDAVLAVYDWLSYLNPFASHSPSLVSQVEKGIAAIKDQFASLTSVGSTLRKVYNDIAAFGSAIASFQGQMDSLQRSEDRAKVAQYAPGALDEFDALSADLRVMRSLLAGLNVDIARQQNVVDSWANALDNANAALDVANRQMDLLRDNARAIEDDLSAARDTLSEFANAPIVGMGAMSDAIFENEMAQKALRLELLRLEEATGPIEDVRSQLSALAGDIELATGEISSLRSGGAGSDILGPMEANVQALRDAYNELQGAGGSSPVNQLQEELENLQRQGEILDLENALQFDSLQRQIEEVVDTSRELTFAEIINGVQQAQAEVELYEGRLQDANDAIKRQEGNIRALELARDSIQATYDQENQKLQALEDTYRAIEDAVRDVETGLRDMTAAADDAIRRAEEAARKAKEAVDQLTPGGENFLAAAGGNFPEVGGTGALGREGGIEDQSALIDQLTQDLANETANMFKGLDIFAPLKEKWNAAWAWIKKNIGPVVGEVGNSIAAAGELIGNAISKWDVGGKIKAAWQSLAGIASFIWSLIGPPLIRIGNAVIGFFKDLWTEVGPEIMEFAELLKPLWEAIQNLWNIVKPILLLLGAAFVAIGSVVLQVVSHVIGPLLDTLIDLIKGAVQIIRGVLKILIGVFTLDFGLIKSGVIDIFSGMWTAVTGLIKGAIGIIIGIIRGFGEGIWNLLKIVWAGVTSGVSSAWNFIQYVIGGVINYIRSTYITPFVNSVIWMKDQIIWAKDKIVSGFNNMRDMVGSAFSAMVENVKGPVRTLFGWINRNLIGNINSVTGIFGLRIPLLPVNFNKGGVVPGGGPNKDSQLAALTPGEGVLTRQTTNALGGKAGIDSLNKWGAVGGPLDFIGDAWGAVKGQIGQWLRKGVGFALDQIMGPVNAAIRALLPDGFVKDFVLGIMTNLRSKMKSWGDTKDAAANVGGTPGAANPGWTLPLPRGSYRIGVGLHGYPGHTGQDLPAAYGTPVFAAAAGVISKAAALVTSYGKNIFIDHPGGYQTRYAHMAQLLAGTGQSVGAGALIGRVDSTGNSTGNHLHFEVRRFGTILNPRSVVGFDNGGVLPPGLSTVFNGTGDFERLARIPNVDRILSELRGDISTMIGSTFVDAMSSTTRDIRRAWVGGAGAVGGIGGLTDATGRVRRVASNRAYTMPGSTGTSEFREIHFHGDLSFPNVKDGSDAERFLENLEGLARG